MTSLNKFKKARNSYCANALKIREGDKLKRLFFFDATARRHIKQKIKKLLNEELPAY